MIDISRTSAILTDINNSLNNLEQELLKEVSLALSQINPAREREKCDEIFGIYSHALIEPYVKVGLSERAAYIGAGLAKAVVELEKKRAVEFHKGALFHDTALAYFLSGNDDQYEYFIAMADEEDLKTTKGSHSRGSSNLRTTSLTAPTLAQRLKFAADLLNGHIPGTPSSGINYAFILGGAPITPERLDLWRKTLDPLHHFEFLRMIHDLYVFAGLDHTYYPSALDNPFVMFRLAKVLAHLSQWIESCLTHWQPGLAAQTLNPKLGHDPDFGPSLSAAARLESRNFPGDSPHGADVDSELRTLLLELSTSTVGPARHWRTLRVLYIARNSTAHVIDPARAIYTDRALLLPLIQVVFLSIFVISDRKRKAMP
jgi:hypothetical protein